jgi:tetratricopeptide (TPR) repeat protein
MADAEHTQETQQQRVARNRESEESAPRRWSLYIISAGIAVGMSIGVLLLMTQANAIFGYAENLKEQESLLVADTNDINDTSVPLGAFVDRANRAFADGNVTDAVQLYERALELGGDIHVMRRMFDAALLIGDQKKAESVLGLLAFRNVSQSTIDALRGLLYLRSGNVDAAHALFLEDSQRSEQVYGLLLVHVLTGNHEEAKRMIALLLLSSDPFLAHTARTIQGAYDEFALFEDGKESHLKTLLARALANVGQCPSAERLLSDVVASDPDYRDAWIILGYCRLTVENAQGALHAFERAYALDPEKAETQFFLGLTNDRLGEDDKARMFLENALQNGFTPGKIVRQKIASMAMKRKMYDKAAEQYRTMIDAGDDDDGSLSHALASLLIYELKDIDGARELALSARDRIGDIPIVLDLVGWTALLADDVDQAATFLQSAVQQDPSMASAWYHKGLLEEGVGEKAQALSSFRKAYDLSLGSDPDLAARAAEKHNAIVAGGM